jgi:hypothetical protein
MQWILAKFAFCLLTDKKNQNCLTSKGGTSQSPMLHFEGRNSLTQNLTFKWLGWYMNLLYDLGKILVLFEQTKDKIMK